MSDFSVFSKALNDKFNKMTKGALFVVGNPDVEGEIPSNRQHEQVYLASWPEGTNPIYKTKTEHDCSCCKQFIRNIGPVVSVVDGKLDTIWNVPKLPYPYDVVAKAMDAHVRSLPIKQVFLATEAKYGAETSLQSLGGTSVKRWEHLWAVIPSKFFSRFPGTQVGAYQSAVQVFRRGLDELNSESLSTISNLIAENNIYRGAEFSAMLVAFMALQAKYKTLSTKERDLFVWSKAMDRSAGFRNTVIGTLAVDLTDGVDLEEAVRGFEAKVAPTNYKRPKALVTQSMIKDAMATIKELDLEDALVRRHARLSDVSVNDVLWADSSAKVGMKGGLEDLLLSSVSTPSSDKLVAQDISWEEFQKQMLKKAQSMEVLFKNTTVPNLMSVTAPVHSGGNLFKWANDFAWSYTGNVADSIKEKVKAAGGNVTNAKLRFSLAWYNHDDLDLHVVCPSGEEISFRNKISGGGRLDVDMNAGYGQTREPVENVSFTSLKDGVYKVIVNQFNKRETSNEGFTVEVESNGQLSHYSYKFSVRAGSNVDVGRFTVKSGVIAKVDIGSQIEGSAFSQEQWGLTTETFVPVNTLMYSPNYWHESAVGNKHVFFILRGCLNDQPCRGIYNEFLSNGLEKHRRVFELLGDKTKCPVVPNQLSGLGFSSTKGESVVVRVETEKGNRLFNVKF